VAVFHPVQSKDHPMLSSSSISAASCERLRRIPLFASFSEEVLASLNSDFYEANYLKETVIFHERDLPATIGSKIYFVLNGCVKLVKYSSDGESTIVRLCSPGEFFGATAALKSSPMPYSAEAFTDTQVLYIEKNRFLAAVQDHPAIALGMLTALGELLWFGYETHNQVVKKTEARVSKILLYHGRREGFTTTPEGEMLNMRLPHDYIASMTGIAYEESVRIISRLKKKYDCIQYLRGGKILITNMDKLNEVAQSEESGYY